MQLHDIDGIIVGADRIVANGDTANKVSYLATWSHPAHTMSDWNVPSCSPRQQAQCPIHGGGSSDDSRLVIEDRSKVSMFLPVKPARC